MSCGASVTAPVKSGNGVCVCGVVLPSLLLSCCLEYRYDCWSAYSHLVTMNNKASVRMGPTQRKVGPRVGEGNQVLMRT